MRRSRLPARLGCAAAMTALVTVAGAPAAFAEGPGYGGTADTLTVSWVSASDVASDTSPDDAGPSDTGTNDAPEAPPVAPENNDSPVQGLGSTAVVIGGGLRSAGVIIRADGQPALNPNGLALEVNGLGFRAKSEVTVRIGDGAPVTSRSDTAGALSVAIDPALLGGTQPGLTVVAVGRAPSGTAVALYGSVPPEPSGFGPMSLVPWVAAAVAAIGGAVWLRNRRRDRQDPESAPLASA